MKKCHVVDVILRDSDLNNTEFIDYAEFKQTENLNNLKETWFGQ